MSTNTVKHLSKKGCEEDLNNNLSRWREMSCLHRRRRRQRQEVTERWTDENQAETRLTSGTVTFAGTLVTSEGKKKQKPVAQNT